MNDDMLIKEEKIDSIESIRKENDKRRELEQAAFIAGRMCRKRCIPRCRFCDGDKR